jgi:DNA polymerase-3 subunit delta'
MRAFEHQFNLTAAPGFLKCGLVIDADRLNEQAQNAFLKTLEEPPKGSLLVLLTTQPRLLLPTIRSRCQIVSALRNRRTYEGAIRQGLPQHLARLRRGAGAAVALEVAHAIKTLLDELRTQAETAAEDDADAAALVDHEASFRKRLQERREARIQAEYLRLRARVAETIQAWFLQQELIACGVPKDELPNPELLEAAAVDPATPGIDPEEADDSARRAVELGRQLGTNADEQLALEAFCLTVCKRNSN